MKIYFINLASRTDKRVFIEKQLNGVFHQIEKITGVEFSSSDNDFFVTSNVKGCARSHQTIFETHSLDLNNDYCLILEDDAKILNLDTLLSIINKVDELGQKLQIDCIQLGFAPTSRMRWFEVKLKTLLRRLEYFAFDFALRLRDLAGASELSHRARVKRAIQVRLIEKKLDIGPLIADEFLPGTQAYIISRSFAQKIALLNKPIFLSADLFMMCVANMRGFRVFRLTKSLVTQDLSFESDIGSNRYRLFARHQIQI